MPTASIIEIKFPPILLEWT